MDERTIPALDLASTVGRRAARKRLREWGLTLEMPRTLIVGENCWRVMSK